MLRTYTNGRWTATVEPTTVVVGDQVYDSYVDARGDVQAFDLHDAWVFHDGTYEGLPERQHGGQSGDADHLWIGVVGYVDGMADADKQTSSKEGES